MKIAYLKTNGFAHDIRYVADDYTAAQDETIVFADELPSVDSLSDGAALQARGAAQLKKGLIDAVQSYLDAEARAHDYDNIFTAVTYADEPTVAQFQQEGQAFRVWRSLVWQHCYGVLAAVQGGTRAVPTAAELVAELPALQL
jgi:hypothetical protein